MHVSPIGLVPKGHGGNAWRMIVDLSYPRGRSVNNFIPSKHLFPHLSLTKRYGGCEPGSWTWHRAGQDWLEKRLPHHSDDRQFLGMSWEGHVYINQCLRSAPKIFTAYADALAWVLHSEGIRYLLYYLECFYLPPPHASGEEGRSLHTAMSTLAALGSRYPFLSWRDQVHVWLLLTEIGSNCGCPRISYIAVASWIRRRRFNMELKKMNTLDIVVYSVIF